MTEENGRYSREFKLSAIQRMETCRNVSALARELGIRRKYLYAWRAVYLQQGVEGLKRSKGRPVIPSAKPAKAEPAPFPALDLEKRVAELERLLGAKQLEIDFFKRTFEHVTGAMQPPTASGGEVSTREFKPGSHSKESD